MASYIRFEDKENGKGIPIKRKKHDNGEEITVNIKLVSQCCNVMDEFNSWKSMKSKAIPYYFLMGNRKLSRYKLVITNLSMSDIRMAAKKEVISSATLAITFSESGSKSKPLTSKKAKAENKKLAAKATRNCKKTKKKVGKLVQAKK